eukprot:scaffold15138_cov88-Cylindrotheca_fusiformis.AAC.1
MALVQNSAGSNNGQRRCYKCGSPDHISPNCPKNKSNTGGKSQGKSNGNGDNPYRKKPDATWCQLVETKEG